MYSATTLDIRPRYRARHYAGGSKHTTADIGEATWNEHVRDRGCPPRAPAEAPSGIELRHLRYFVAVAEAGTFTHAAERMFIAQPTLSQQIRRLEEMMGTPLLQRRREGVRLTTAGTVLLEESRAVLSQIDHGMSRTRQAAGLGRPRLRVVIPRPCPRRSRSPPHPGCEASAAAADVDVTWLETSLDAEFSLIRERQADAGLGWLTTEPRGTARPSRRHEPRPSSSPRRGSLRRTRRRAAAPSASASWPAWTSSTVRAGPAPAPTTPGWRSCGPRTCASNSPTRRSGTRCP